MKANCALEPLQSRWQGGMASGVEEWHFTFAVLPGPTLSIVSGQSGV